MYRNFVDHRGDLQVPPLPNDSVQLTIPIPVNHESPLDDEATASPKFTWRSRLVRANFAINPTPTDDGSIRSTMEEIGHGIQDVVLAYVSSLGISERQIAFLDGSIRYPPECLGLLGQVLGGIGVYGSQRRSERLLTFHQTQTSLRGLLYSFICCAITQWCFHADLDEDRYYSLLSGGDVQKTFNKGM